MSRTDRLFQLMQALRSVPPPATAAQLAAMRDVTPRTIYRDIEALRGLGAVIGCINEMSPLWNPHSFHVLRQGSS